MILIIDNYDSFVYNLYQYIGTKYKEVMVRRNDEITIEEIQWLNPVAIILSPGPGYPKDAGICKEVIRHFGKQIPILGVCLGHQTIAEAFGGKIIRAKYPMHGKQTLIFVDSYCKIFDNLTKNISVGRYHSLIVERESLPSCLEVIATSEQGEIMGMVHNKYPIYGVQFHPESILTNQGKRIIDNFLIQVVGLSIKQEALVAQDEKNTLKPFIKQLMEGKDLSQDQAQTVMECIMDGGATNTQIGALMMLLSMKGESVNELIGFAKVMRKKAKLIHTNDKVIDIVGTGGDMADTFNISTTTCFVVAGAGAKVAKHGNRSVSSKSGSADVLERLGVKIDVTPEIAQKCLEEVGICFMFAPCFHHAMRFAAQPRKELGVKSVFNLLGPLANPAFADYMVLGVYDKALVEKMGQVLMGLGVKHALVVYGEDGLDEVSICSNTVICEVAQNKLIKYTINPEMYGIQRAEKETIVGGNADKNAQILLCILEGEKGPMRDIVVLNAAVALYAAHHASTIEEGMKKAQKAIDSGEALRKFYHFKKFME